MNTKQLILFFMVIALLAIQCSANIYPRQDNDDPGSGDKTTPSEGDKTTPPSETSPTPDPNPNPTQDPSPNPNPNPTPDPNPNPVTPDPVIPSTTLSTQPVETLPSSPIDLPPQTGATTSSVPSTTDIPPPANDKSGNKTTYILIGIGAVAIVICILAVLFIRNKRNNKEEYNFTHQPTAVTYGNNYQNEQPAYTQGYATAVNEGYDQYNNQEQYGQDQYNNQGYDQGYNAPQDQYNNQGYDQGYNGQNQYGQGYDQTYPQPADDGQVIPGNQYTIRYDFKPSLNDEIELEPGNVVEIIEVYDDGWAKGKNLTYNTEGVFPVNRITGVDDSKKARYSSLPRPVQ